MDLGADPEEIKARVKEIADDFYLYCEKNLKIKTKEGKIVPFEPNSAQKALIERVLGLLDEGKPIRLIVLKARQMGISTVIEALVYWWTATHKHITSMIVAHDKEASKNLYNMFKRYYDNCHQLFQPTRKYDTKSDLTFAKDNEDGTTGGLQSTIKTGTAQETAVGRSDTVQILHCSEVASWRNGYELVAGLFQTVPLMANTMIFLESTAEGIGNYFHDEWKSSKTGDSIFEPFFFAWWQHDEYELEGEITHHTPEEKRLIEIFKKNDVPEEKWDRKLFWRRLKLKEFKGDPDKFKQEYPATDTEAFLASGRPRFDINSLIKMEEQTKEPEYVVLEDRGRKVKHRTVVESPLKVWEYPKQGKKYTIGVDVAEGLKDGDYSVVDVMDTDTRTTVARWRGHTDPDVLGDITEQIGRWYNYALVGVEINNHGLTTVQRLRDHYYTNLYRREKGFDEQFEESTSKLGWKTDSRTKPLMIDHLAQAIREGSITDYDKVFVNECMSYVVDDSGKTNAQSGTHDDTVIAKAINLQMFNWQFLDKERIKVHKPKKILEKKRNKR